MKYHIWSIEHGAWWGHNHCGYVLERSKAGEYTEQEAIEVCNGANRYRKDHFPPNEAMVPIIKSTPQTEGVTP